jgi:hypothetical protein
MIGQKRIKTFGAFFYYRATILKEPADKMLQGWV